MKRIIAGCVFLLLTASLTPASAQKAFGLIEKSDKARASSLSALYEAIERDVSTISDEQVADIPGYLFAEILNPELPDIMVLIDSNGVMRPPLLVMNGKKRTYVRGKDFVWVVVISTKDHTKESGGSKTQWREVEWGALPWHLNYPMHSKTHEVPKAPEAVNAKLSPLRYTATGEGAWFRSIVSAVGKLFGGIENEAAPAGEAAKDSSETIELEEVWTEQPTQPVGASKKTLYAGMAKFKLWAPSINRAQVSVPESNGPEGAYATFGNYDSSFFGASLGFAATGHRSNVEDADEQMFVVLADIYVVRPRIPRPQLEGNRVQRWATSLGWAVSVGAGFSSSAKAGSRVLIGITAVRFLQSLDASLLFRRASEEDDNIVPYGALTFHI